MFNCLISDKVKLTNLIYKYTIICDEIAGQAIAGQFLHIKCGDERILRRPISISDVNNNEVSFVVEIRGEGTKWLCAMEAGNSLDIIGPLGNGFRIPDGNTILVGGGVGVPPLLYAAKQTKYITAVISGFRNKESIILVEEFKKICDIVCVTTDDGSYGKHGTVIKPLKELISNGKNNSVLTCGPRPMMAAVAKLCKEFSIPCQVSLEERMGCGIGACMVCACKTTGGGDDKMSLVCKDGPVFDASEVVW